MKKLFKNKDLSTMILTALIAIIVWIPTVLGFDYQIYMMIASWIWIPSLIICGRKAKKFKEYLILFAGICLSATLVHYGLYGTGILELVPNIICTLIVFPAFLADSILNHKYKSFLTTIVFPFTYTLLLLLLSYLYIGVCFRFDMFSSILLIPYQIASIVGAYGSTFIMSWLMTSIIYAIENRKDISRLKTSIICPLVLVPVLIFGCVRYFTAPEPEFAFKVAYAVGPYRSDFLDEDFDVPYEENVAYLKSTSKSAAEQGASLLAYTEEAFFFKGLDIADGFVNIAKQEAITNNISILLCVEAELEDEISQNKIIWIDSTGDIKAEYLKSHVIPVLEAPYYEAGDNIIPYVDFDVDGHNVRISTAICYDSDDPLYTYTLDKDTDVFMVPSWDWRLIQGKHTASTAYIPLQNHVTFVKITYDGYTGVIDPYGRKSYFELIDVEDPNVYIIDVPVF